MLRFRGAALIHYFASSNDKMACDEHKGPLRRWNLDRLFVSYSLDPDTGLITLIVVSEVNGLEVKLRYSFWLAASEGVSSQVCNKADSTWVPVDKIARPWQLLCIIGEKIPHFSRSPLFPGTLHRVVRSLCCDATAPHKLSHRLRFRTSVTRWRSCWTSPSDPRFAEMGMDFLENERYSRYLSRASAAALAHRLAAGALSFLGVTSETRDPGRPCRRFVFIHRDRLLMADNAENPAKKEKSTCPLLRPSRLPFS